MAHVIIDTKASKNSTGCSYIEFSDDGLQFGAVEKKDATRFDSLVDAMEAVDRSGLRNSNGHSIVRWSVE